MTPLFSAIDLDADYVPVSRRFHEAAEAKHTPSREELLTMDFADDDEAVEAPVAMTGNDAFRIIEIIKEREAATRDAAA